MSYNIEDSKSEVMHALSDFNNYTTHKQLSELPKTKQFTRLYIYVHHEIFSKHRGPANGKLLVSCRQAAAVRALFFEPLADFSRPCFSQHVVIYACELYHIASSRSVCIPADKSFQCPGDMILRYSVTRSVCDLLNRLQLDAGLAFILHSTTFYV